MKLVMIAGPNGAGKTTAAPHLLQGALRVTQFVNADTIAQGLSAFEPERSAIPAGRIMLDRLRELAARGTDFAFEATLASRSFVPWIRRCMGGTKLRFIAGRFPSKDGTPTEDVTDARLWQEIKESYS